MITVKIGRWQLHDIGSATDVLVVLRALCVNGVEKLPGLKLEASTKIDFASGSEKCTDAR